jgi:hypothetical protein
VVAAFIATAFAQEHAEAARQQWRRVADQLRPKVPKLATLMDEAAKPCGSSMVTDVSYTTPRDTI